MENRVYIEPAAKRVKVRGFLTTTNQDDPWHEVEVKRLHDFARWSDGWKRRLGFTAGLTVLRLRWTHPDRPHKPYWTLTVAARHWPHLLCWQWHLSFRMQRGRRYEYRRLCHFWRHGRQWTFAWLWLFHLHWASQGYDCMVAEPFKSQSPMLYPLHEGEARTRVH